MTISHQQRAVDNWRWIRITWVFRDAIEGTDLLIYAFPFFIVYAALKFLTYEQFLIAPEKVVQEKKKRKVKLRLSRYSTQTYVIFNKQEKKGAKNNWQLLLLLSWAVQQQKRLEYNITRTILQARAWWFLPTPQFRWPTYHHFINYRCVCTSRWDIPIEKEPVACAPKKGFLLNFKKNQQTNKKSMNDFGCCALTHPAETDGRNL